MVRIFVVLLILISSSAFASDVMTESDCTLDYKFASSPIDDKSPNINTLKAPYFDSLILFHKVEFKDGAKLTYSEKACVHYGYFYEFRNIKNFPKKLDDKTITLIKSYLAKVPLKDNKKDPSQLAEVAFSQAAKLERNEHQLSETDFAVSYTNDPGYFAEFNPEVHFKMYSDGFEISYFAYP